ncbi:MAG: HD domain-containing protein [Synechococcales cyanobacterium T60_A2020_003]|nr:HD domain-containing protein [Synechococcales cyanobacterium T60_A2020_003]
MYPTIAVESRLSQQLQFVMEIDKLKTILRQTLITDGSRRENSAEHSWHIALMAIAFVEYAPEAVDLLHVVKLLLVHDLVEIDAGDTFCYDDHGNDSKPEREQRAAERLFGLLPPDQACEFRAYWDEYEEQITTNAQFAKALDCLQPFLNNLQTNGHTWRLHGISRRQVEGRMQAIAVGAPALWSWVEQHIEGAIAAGYLKA